MKRMLIGAALAGAAILAGTALSQGYGPEYAALNLSDEQRKKIDAVQEELWTKQGALMGRMHAQSFRMHDFGKGAQAHRRGADARATQAARPLA
jgi:hypothetical protein